MLVSCLRRKQEVSWAQAKEVTSKVLGIRSANRVGVRLAMLFEGSLRILIKQVVDYVIISSTIVTYKKVERNGGVCTKR